MVLEVDADLSKRAAMTLSNLPPQRGFGRALPVCHQAVNAEAGAGVAPLEKS